MQPILKVRGAQVTFPAHGGSIRALDGVDLDVNPGEIVALVGESGCGKTTLARAVLGLQPLTAGSIEVVGRRIERTPRNLAETVGMVWQDPYASLDPRWRVRKSAMESAALVGRKVDADALLATVGLDPSLSDRYPHQLSGGQRQRVAIARALALRPPLVICDEPTAALDLSIRAQILNLLKSIQAQERCSFLYISHDLTTVRFLASRVAVMYLGRIVEEAPTEELFNDPKHPYTRLLLSSAPSIDKLLQLPEAPEGEIPDPRTVFVGCRFAGRCPRVAERCRTEDPAATHLGERRFYCHYPHNEAPSESK